MPTIESWYFLFSILVSDPTVADGWAVTRHTVTAETYTECHQKREGVILRYREKPILGGGVVITNCQLWRNDDE